MPGGSARQALGDLRTLFRLGVASELSDGQLLDRFVERRDEGGEDAFALLVRRHGPMVFGVCRRILASPHEAEDAFQATFLVLARKANTIARRDTLANWLYGVALRTAKDARSRTRRRRAWEERACQLRVVQAGGDDPFQELRLILDEELARLPARFRATVLLCELESLSRQEAARRLGIPEGTLSSRLARAKALLRERLTRRGLSISTALLTGCLVREAQASMLSGALVESTIRAATFIAAGCSMTGLVTAPVQSLVGEVLSAMLYAKIKGIGLALLVACAVVTGAMVLAQDTVSVGDHAQTKSADPFDGSPKPEQPLAKAAFSDTVRTRSEPDRLGALEQKLDRILEALGPTRQAPPVVPPPPIPLDAGFTIGTLAHGQTLGAQPERPSTSAPDRLTTLERRMAEIERRMAEIERRVNQAGSSTSAASRLN